MKTKLKPTNPGWINRLINWKIQGSYQLYGKDLMAAMISHYMFGPLVDGEAPIIQRKGTDINGPWDNGHFIDRYKPGQKMTIFAGAPGTGHATYKITRIDLWGLWGVLVEDTRRILTEADVI